MSLSEVTESNNQNRTIFKSFKSFSSALFAPSPKAPNFGALNISFGL